MKKIMVLLISIFLCGCTIFETNSNTETSINTSNLIKPFIVYSGTDNSTGYIIGGIINGKIVNLQDDDNYKLFELSGNEKYMFFPVNGVPIPIRSKGIETNFISSTGTYEIEIQFEKTDELLNNKYIGIGNLSNSIVIEKELIDAEGSFILDFDNDGYTEKINIEKSIDNNISIILNNQQGKTQISEFTIDNVYTNKYELFTIDIDEDGNQELIISLFGHDYSTEIYKITSNKNEKVIGYYMGN